MVAVGFGQRTVADRGPYYFAIVPCATVEIERKIVAGYIRDEV
jgi:hypothetical protein